MEDLINVLKAETVLYDELLPIAETKTRVIVENNLERLENITATEQEIVDQVTALESRRMKIIENIGTVLSRDPKTLKVKDIIQFLERQPKEQKELSILHDHLKDVVHKLMEVNSRNRTLLVQSLEMAEFNVNVLQSARMGPGNNNYTKGARNMMDAPSAQVRMFDKIQ